jgi:hypothetical protein
MVPENKCFEGDGPDTSRLGSEGAGPPWRILAVGSGIRDAELVLSVGDRRHRMLPWSFGYRESPSGAAIGSKSAFLTFGPREVAQGLSHRSPGS